jgi:excisionase family DNA binding protein
MQKLKKPSKGGRRKRALQPGSPEHGRWRSNVAKGMRRAHRRRRAAGLLTFAEAAAVTLWPVNALRKMADSGDLGFVQVGSRRYLRESDVSRLKAA